MPLLDRERSRHSLELACRLAVDGARVLLLAPLYVEWELPLDAHFEAEEAALRAELDAERALAEGYSVSVGATIVRARHGQVGRAVADVARDVDASMIVLGAAVESRRDSRRPFPRDVCAVIEDAPCPVLIASEAPQARARAVA